MENEMKPEEKKDEAPPASPAPTGEKKALGNKNRFAIGFGVALLVAAIGSVASAYALPPTNPLVRKVASALPLPAAVVGTDRVSIAEFLIERDALKSYFGHNAQAQAPASESELDTQVLDTLVNKKALEALAKARGITVDPAKADALEAQMQGDGDKAAFEAQLKEQFGWTPEQFRARVVNSLVLATAMTDALNADEDAQKDAKAEADAALARVAAGEEFAKVATEASKDPSASAGGDIGYQPVTSLPDDIKAVVTPLKKGEHSGVVESPEAFLVIQLTDRVKGKDGEEDKLSVIVIPKKSLQETVDAYLAGTRVWKLIKT